MAIIGIDIGGTKILTASCDRQGAFLFRARINTPQAPSDALNQLTELVRAAASHVPDEKIDAIGISCGGPLDPREQTVSPLHLPQWRGLELGRELRSEFNCPVRLENDADAGAFAEYHVAGAEIKRLLYVTLSTGLGGGILVDGEIYRGHNHSHPEIGHQNVPLDPDIKQVSCTCGATNCLEALISGLAIEHRYGKKAADLNREEWTEVGVLLGRGLRNAAVMLAPGEIVISGGVAVGGGELLLAAACAELKRNVHIVPCPHLRLSRLDYDAALWGALALGFDAANMKPQILQAAAAERMSRNE